MVKKKNAKTEAKKKTETKASAKPENPKATAKKLAVASKPMAKPSSVVKTATSAKMSLAAPKAASRQEKAEPKNAGNLRPDKRGAKKTKASSSVVELSKNEPASNAARVPDRPKLPTRKLPTAELSRIRNVLAQKKLAISNHLQSELTELEKPEKRHRADLEEIASDTHDTDSLCEIMDIEATQIDQIDMALAKIDNGTYGVCEDCGKDIPLPRLEALPFATQCIDCKRRAEIQGQIAASDQSPAGF